jgi:hypothetical protein
LLRVTVRVKPTAMRLKFDHTKSPAKQGKFTSLNSGVKGKNAS